MEILHSEKYPGVSGETYEVKIIDFDNKNTVAINLVFIDNEEERSVNIRQDDYPINSDLNELIEKAKIAITTISIIDRETKSKEDVNIFEASK